MIYYNCRCGNDMLLAQKICEKCGDENPRHAGFLEQQRLDNMLNSIKKGLSDSSGHANNTLISSGRAEDVRKAKLLTPSEYIRNSLRFLSS